VCCHQVLYNLGERGLEWRLRALCHEHDIRIIAYSPFGQGALLSRRKLATLAASYKLTPAQLALAWLLAQREVIAIPQSSNVSHVTECRAAADVRLPPEALAAIDGRISATPTRAAARDVVIRMEGGIASGSSRAVSVFVRHK